MSGCTHLQRSNALSTKKRMLLYMAGWSCSASCGFIPQPMQYNDDFMEGWHAGRLARKLARECAESKYGEKFAIIGIASPRQHEIESR